MTHWQFIKSSLGPEKSAPASTASSGAASDGSGWARWKSRGCRMARRTVVFLK